MICPDVAAPSNLVLGALVALVAILLGSYVGFYHHSMFMFYAREHESWKQRADYYAGSMMRFGSVDTCAWPVGYRAIIDLMVHHDQENYVRCSAYAREWLRRIPERLQPFYLRKLRLDGLGARSAG